jgi:hypothetical protein
MLSKVMRRFKQGSWFFVGFGGLLILNLKTVIDERQKGVPIENRKRNLKKTSFSHSRGEREI